MSDPMLARRELIALLSRIGIGGLLGGTADRSAAGSTAVPAAFPAAAKSPRGAAHIEVGVRLDRNRPGVALTSRFAGLSYEKDKLREPMFTPGNGALLRLYQLLGPGVLRIGANAVDRCAWLGGTPGLAPIHPEMVDALAAFARRADWQVIYGINLANNTTALAAAESSYVARALGDNLLAFEIGNEPDLYPHNGHRPRNWGYGDYLTEWRAMASAIAAAAPMARLAGPVSASFATGFTLPFARDAAGEISLLTGHYYRADGRDPGSTLDLLLQPDPALPEQLRSVSQAVRDSRLPLGWRMGECNSFFNGGAPNISNTHGTALWVMDFMFRCALDGCSGVNLHGGGHGPGYTPIADDSGQIVEVRPVYYGLLLFALAAQGTSVPGLIDGPVRPRFSAHGVLRDDRGVNVLMINKEAATTVDAELQLGQAVSGLEPFWLTAPDLAATSGQAINAATVAADGTWALEAQATVPVRAETAAIRLPPASAVLLRSRP
ncbi:hypothetical protein LQG66_33620 [Bradyrhizobium ontarionense]|uniref:Beta-glucuronidase C-terminal domain-containing protein n=1 Tax=Bradyrhizobium ontarionense TaxID=2898149 RepID=A0ABY3RA05_9BRAD|nr:hypothetical protein [Bradyrhizobium sp. A19]UFZ04078.1 hypothetical protein LQG66_33620 [Bradyrhizobium sp. A19]